MTSVMASFRLLSLTVLRIFAIQKTYFLSRSKVETLNYSLTGVLQGGLRFPSSKMLRQGCLVICWTDDCRKCVCGHYFALHSCIKDYAVGVCVELRSLHERYNSCKTRGFLGKKKCVNSSQPIPISYVLISFPSEDQILHG